MKTRENQSGIIDYIILIVVGVVIFKVLSSTVVLSPELEAQIAGLKSLIPESSQSSSPLTPESEDIVFEGQPAKRILGASDQRLFGFFPVKVEREIITHAETGRTLRVSQSTFSSILDMLSE